MERKRNRPEKYNRELLHKTVTAVEKVTAVSALAISSLERHLPSIDQTLRELVDFQYVCSEILLPQISLLGFLRIMSKTSLALQVREKRQDRHYEKRMAKAMKNTVTANKTELKNEIHLLKAPHAEKQKIEILEKIPQTKGQKVVPMQTD